MKKDFTDITIVLDKSGSMQPIAKDTIGGVNRFIDEQQKTPGEAKLTLCLFDHEYERTVRGIRIHDVKLLDEQSYIPNGNTCLFGAVGTAIQETGARLAGMPEAERPEHVIFVIVTDGEENSSHKHEWSQRHTHASIKTAIEHQSAVYNWRFVYIGANQDAIANAGRMGVAAGSALNYTSNQAGTSKLYGDLSKNVRDLRRRLAKDLDWSDEQRKAQESSK